MLLTGPEAGWAEGPAAGAVGVVSHVKVLCDHVRDVSSLAAWKRSFIHDGMTDEQKALAIWRSTVMFRYQDPPPLEFLEEDCVHDPIKTFNVYGYGMCCCASSNIEALARYLGLEARGWAVNGHSLPEVNYDHAWHMLDASLVNYFPKPDGKIASMAELVAAVKGWLAEHPELKQNDAKLRQLHQSQGWLGWKQGPALLTHCPFYDWSGWWPAKTHGWYSTMQEYDGSHNTPFPYEYAYSQGYEVNIQLRRGERLTRNWFNKGLHINGMTHDGDAPGCLHGKIGSDAMAYLTGYGDLASGRIGSGALEYDVPLADGGFRGGAWKAENLASKAEEPGAAVHVKDPAEPGVLEIEMPSSYVYLAGELALDAAVGKGGDIEVLFSANNGLDWRQVTDILKSGKQKIDLGKLVLRRYDYRLRFVLTGQGTGLDALRIAGTIQCSQRALPTLVQGDNTISFSAGPAEGTVTVQGSSTGRGKGKNVTLADFKPTLVGVEPQFLRVHGSPAEVTVGIATPADMTRLRFGGHYRARDKADRWDVSVSCDGGKSFRDVEPYLGPTQGKCQYATVSEIPPGTRAALVRWSGHQRNTTCLFFVRIDADYRQSQGGFRPVKVTYVWQEGGAEKKDVHVSRRPDETYHIPCASKPEMKSIALEWE